MMKLMLSISVGVLFLGIGFCTKPPAEQSNKAAPISTPERNAEINCDWKGEIVGNKKSDLQRFLVGKWEGSYEADQRIEMYLTFQEDGTAVVAYSPLERGNVPKGRASYRPYRINADKTLNICGYPDRFTVKRYGRDEFELVSDNKKIYSRGDIEIIYICRFRRAKI